MAPISAYLADKILNFVFSTAHTSWSANTTGVWVGFHTADPGKTGTNAPLASCPRMLVPFGAAASATCANNATASVVSSASGTITHVTMWDSSDTASGNHLWYGTLTASKQIGNAGDTITLAIAALAISVSTS